MADLHLTLPSGTEVALSNAGTPFAEQLVVLCNPQGIAGLLDPDPAATRRRAVHIVVIDPLAVGGQPAVLTPAEHAATIAEYVRYAHEVGRDTGAGELEPIGVIGWGSGSLVAVALALDHGELVDRVALIAPDFGAEAHAVGRGTDEDIPVGGTGGDRASDLGGRVERALVHDGQPSSAAISEGGGAELAARWAAGPARRDEVLVLEGSFADSTSESSAGDGGVAGSATVAALAAHWEQALRHVESEDR